MKWLHFISYGFRMSFLLGFLLGSCGRQIDPTAGDLIDVMLEMYVGES